MDVDKTCGPLNIISKKINNKFIKDFNYKNRAIIMIMPIMIMCIQMLVKREAILLTLQIVFIGHNSEKHDQCCN